MEKPQEELNPLDPDAPIQHYLSVSKNPAVVHLSDHELTELIKRVRTVATSPQTMTSVLQNESKRRRPMSAAQLKRKEILDSI